MSVRFRGLFCTATSYSNCPLGHVFCPLCGNSEAVHISEVENMLFLYVWQSQSGGHCWLYRGDQYLGESIMGDSTVPRKPQTLLHSFQGHVEAVFSVQVYILPMNDHM